MTAIFHVRQKKGLIHLTSNVVVMEFPSLAVTGDWCRSCCCHWQKFLSRSYQWGGRKFLFYCLNSHTHSSVFVDSRHIWMRADRISKELTYRFVEGCGSSVVIFQRAPSSSLKEKMKNTFSIRTLLHLEFLPFLAATDISKGLVRTRQLYVCFKGLGLLLFFFSFHWSPIQTTN